MPLFIPIVIAAGSAALGATGAALGARGVTDSKNAARLVEDAKGAYDAQVTLTRAQYELAEDALGRWGRCKHDVYDDQIRRFVNAFDALGGADLSALSGTDTLEELVRALEVTKIDFELLDAARAILAGGGTAAASYAIAWGAVGSFGTASTSTAISALGGAAASNAILAWFGGGSLAAGGFGAGVGGAILGGAVAGPAVIAVGAVLRKKGADALRAAQEETAKLGVATQEAKAWAAAYRLLDVLAQDYLTVANRLSAVFEGQLADVECLACAGLRLVDLDDEQLAAVTAAADAAVVLKGVLDTPLVDTETGKPRRAARRHINRVKTDQGLWR